MNVDQEEKYLVPHILQYRFLSAYLIGYTRDDSVNVRATNRGEFCLRVLKYVEKFQKLPRKTYELELACHIHLFRDFTDIHILSISIGGDDI